MCGLVLDNQISDSAEIVRVGKRVTKLNVGITPLELWVAFTQSLSEYFPTSEARLNFQISSGCVLKLFCKADQIYWL